MLYTLTFQLTPAREREREKERERERERQTDRQLSKVDDVVSDRKSLNYKTTRFMLIVQCNYVMCMQTCMC